MGAVIRTILILSVVVAVADAAHGWLYAGLLQPFGGADGQILDPRPL